ncbi:sensor histidine kinase [Pedobacter agri]|uniref:histidine kinase n=1 Tax=Pedobacter agri TaxID=454586 RepID=A0A9X3I9U1_9SPHI|nr:HAMP domain-containing sensor histidine kinase [Pedobacter agri]MCX3264898.1 HAMP domain-containing sensor histidine kinase [Pedobacter agri]
MHKKAGLLVVVCFVAMAGLLALQAFWIVKYYHVTKLNFEKEVNLAFEDGIKKELGLRCDTIQKIVENKILDTNTFNISARFDKNDKKYVYTISTKADVKDKFSSSFSLADYSKALPRNKRDTNVRRHVAAALALLMRDEDLEQHIIYYRTQKLGVFMNEQAMKYQFDTTRLRSAFNIYLKERNINVPYRFMVKKVDSTNNKGVANAKLAESYPVITKSFATYRYTDNQRFVRAMFKSPSSYIVSRIGLILFSSLAMILVISGCMILILKSLFREKRLSAIKNDFISNITHEFKTPIATVLVAIEALKDKAVLADEEKTRRYLAHAKTETERLNLLVDKVMNLSIYQDESMVIKKENIHFDEIIEGLIKLHQLSEHKQISIDYENKSGVSIVNADKIQFQHAINNVLDNALKYSKAAVKLKVSISLKDNFLVIRLQDDGIGIAEQEISLVFEKFYRVGTGNNHLVKGHGLGLSYVKQIMEQHAGWVRIESKPEYGTTLILGWPI